MACAAMPGDNDVINYRYSFRSPEFEDTFRGVAARKTGQASAWMAASATQEESVYRCVVLRGAMQGPHHERLVNRQFAVVPVAPDTA